MEKLTELYAKYHAQNLICKDLLHDKILHGKEIEKYEKANAKRKKHRKAILRILRQNLINETKVTYETV